MRSATSLPASSISQPALGAVAEQVAVASPERRRVSLFVAGSGSANPWWPAELGNPASTGAQNDLRYAFFPGPRRLAIREGGRVRVYDTGEHRLSGFSQQQGGDQSLTFTSQFGLVRVADLPLVDPHSNRPPSASAAASPQTPAARRGGGAGYDFGGGRHSQNDRRPGGAAPERHHHGRRVFGEKGRASGAPLTLTRPWPVWDCATARRRR